MNAEQIEEDEIERDQQVIASATPGPWTAEYADDDLAMNAIMITRPSAVGELDDHENNVAIVLLQTPRVAVIGDGKWHENAEFIARARSRWPAALDRIAALEGRIASLERQLKDAKQRSASN